MATVASMFGIGRQEPRQEVLDLRHFSAAQLRPLLFDEAKLWDRRLRWDYSKSVELLLEYLDGRVLPGFAVVQNGKVAGYAFAVLEGAKAVIGDAYAFGETATVVNPVCDVLMEHLIEMLQATPGVDRIESQLLMFPVGAMAGAYGSQGFRSYPRLFMMGEVGFAAGTPISKSERSGAPSLPVGLKMEAWRAEFYDAAAELIHRCYVGHQDSDINDQYRSVAGSLRFLHNIIRFPGCGIFDAGNSWVLRDLNGEMKGLLLSSRVRKDVAHVTQLCVAPALRGLGLGRLLMQKAARELGRSGGTALSLTVTEGNAAAMRLYEELGFGVVRRFEAMVWDGGA